MVFYGCLEHGNTILGTSWTYLRFCRPCQVNLGIDQQIKIFEVQHRDVEGRFWIELAPLHQLPRRVVAAASGGSTFSPKTCLSCCCPAFCLPEVRRPQVFRPQVFRFVCSLAPPIHPPVLPPVLGGHPSPSPSMHPVHTKAIQTPETAW